jgi:hypothetical protein
LVRLTGYRAGWHQCLVTDRKIHDIVVQYKVNKNCVLFANFFWFENAFQKLEEKRRDYPSASQLVAPSAHPLVKELSRFESCTEDELEKILKAAPVKSCCLDPIPTWLLCKCQDGLLPVIVHIINRSLLLGEVPASLSYAP